MDRRQEKTRAALFSALNRLLERKRFEALTVQDLLNEANVGRSTFYAHFRTKEDVLRQFCGEFLAHVFSPLGSKREHTHLLCGNCLAQSVCVAHQTPGFECALCHILCHLTDNHARLALLLTEAGGSLFLREFRRHLEALLADGTLQLAQRGADAPPRDFVLNTLAGSFWEMVRWWLHGNLAYRPEELAHWFVSTAGGIHCRSV